jgi:hypothetical protein
MRRLDEGQPQSNSGLSHVVTFQDCVFRDNALGDGMSFPGIIENSFLSELIITNCLFENNRFGIKGNPAPVGYAMRSFGPTTVESSCFVDNVFQKYGPILVYGNQYSALNNYVEASQSDLTCELAALFSSQDEMAEGADESSPRCELSDAVSCAFSQAPTIAPTVVPVAPTSLTPEKPIIPPTIEKEKEHTTTVSGSAGDPHAIYHRQRILFWSFSVLLLPFFVLC